MAQVTDKKISGLSEEELMDYNNSNENQTTDNDYSVNRSVTHDIEFFYKAPKELMFSIAKEITFQKDKEVFIDVTGNKHRDKEKEYVPNRDELDDFLAMRFFANDGSSSFIDMYIDPENPDISYIHGKGTSETSPDGQKQRWSGFDLLYKIMKQSEINGKLKEMSKYYGHYFGGKIVIKNNKVLEERGDKDATKEFKIGAYNPEDVSTEILKIYDEYRKKYSVVKKMTISDAHKHFLEDGNAPEGISIPVFGYMDKDNDKKNNGNMYRDSRREVGKLFYDTVLDPIEGKEHKVLRLSISDEVTAPSEVSLDFINTINLFTRNVGLDIEGVLPDRNITHDKEGKCQILMINKKEAGKFDCESPRELNAVILNHEVNGKILNVSPSSLSYDPDGTFNTRGISVPGLILKPKVDEKTSTATASVYQASYYRRAVVDAAPNADYAKFIFNAHDIVNMKLPDVHKLFEGKKAKMIVMKSPLTWLAGCTIKESGFDKADVWHVTAPVPNEEKTEELFDHLYELHKEGVDLPKEIRFDSIAMGGSPKQITITKPQLKNMFDAMTKAIEVSERTVDKEQKDSIEFPDF